MRHSVMKPEFSNNWVLCSALDRVKGRGGHFQSAAGLTTTEHAEDSAREAHACGLPEWGEIPWVGTADPGAGVGSDGIARRPAQASINGPDGQSGPPPVGRQRFPAGRINVCSM